VKVASTSRNCCFDDENKNVIRNVEKKILDLLDVLRSNVRSSPDLRLTFSTEARVALNEAFCCNFDDEVICTVSVIDYISQSQ